MIDLTPVLNLGGFNIPDTYPTIPFKSSTFPGGEEFIRISRKDGINDPITICTRLNSSKDIMQLLMATDALRRLGVESIHLYTPYFPYARQDRVMNNGESLSVKVLADLINSLKFDSVTILDPHSDVTPSLLNNLYVYDNSLFIQYVMGKLSKDIVIVSPDGGASKKISKLCHKLNLKNDVVQCLKVRDLKTTEITETQVFGDVNGRDCIIIDDICDGGRTFTTLAQKLIANGANNLCLAVTHGIFSHGFEELNKYFQYIFTTDSFYREQSSGNLTVFNMTGYHVC